MQGDLLHALVEIVHEIDRRNLYINPQAAFFLRRHGFNPHNSYLRPPPPPPRPVCPGLTRAGARCKNKCSAGMDTCLIHSQNPTPRPLPTDEYRCRANTGSGERCKRARCISGMCWTHAKKAGLLPEEPTECSICYSVLSEGVKVKTLCNHFFHEECFNNWKVSRQNLGHRVTCPMCRNSRPNPRTVA